MKFQNRKLYKIDFETNIYEAKRKISKGNVLSKKSVRTSRVSPDAAQDDDSKRAFAISATDASAIAKGVRKPALYNALAREP